MTNKSPFVSAMENWSKWEDPTNIATQTDNGAYAVTTTSDPLLDLFGTIGAMRGATNQHIVAKFKESFNRDPLLAMKILFYARDVREGLGERNVFKVILKELADAQASVLKANLANVPFFGRFDDLFVLENTDLDAEMWAFLRNQFASDWEAFNKGESFSLMAKWMPSMGTESNDQRFVRRMAKKFGLPVNELRKRTSAMRKALDVVEVKQSAGDWSEIDYSAVPSRAMLQYRTAFHRHDGDRYSEFIDRVLDGEEKVNAATLYPYDLLEALYIDTSYRGLTVRNKGAIREVQAQWNALPNFVQEGANILVMADTSGSMGGRPMHTSVGLAIYFAERNRGDFKNVFMTFSSRPSFITLPENGTLIDKINAIPSIVDNTNIEAAFDLILRTSVENNVPQEDMPKSLVIISDMQFDDPSAGCADYNQLYHDRFREKYAKAGYELPTIVYWNVNSPRDVFHANKDLTGVQLVSGQSASIFKQVVNSIGKTAFESMLDTLNDPRYDVVTLG